MYVAIALTLYDSFRLYASECSLSPLGADQIDKHSLEIAQADDETYTNVQELADELPDHSPRFVLLSYPLTLVGSSEMFLELQR